MKRKLWVYAENHKMQGKNTEGSINADDAFNAAFGGKMESPTFGMTKASLAACEASG